MTTTKQREADEAVATLRELIEPGSTLFTTVRHVSPPGMTRWIDVYRIEDGEPRWLSPLVAKATSYTFDQRREAVKVEGCGMDMGFALVYSLSQALFPDGFDCIGEGCPSNDHSNGDRDYTPGHVTHRSGGYAIRQRWL